MSHQITRFAMVHTRKFVAPLSMRHSVPVPKSILILTRTNKGRHWDVPVWDCPKLGSIECWILTAKNYFCNFIGTMTSCHIKALDDQKHKTDHKLRNRCLKQLKFNFSKQNIIKSRGIGKESLTRYGDVREKWKTKNKWTFIINVFD